MLLIDRYNAREWLLLHNVDRLSAQLMNGVFYAKDDDRKASFARNAEG